MSFLCGLVLIVAPQRHPFVIEPFTVRHCCENSISRINFNNLLAGRWSACVSRKSRFGKRRRGQRVDACQNRSFWYETRSRAWISHRPWWHLCYGTLLLCQTKLCHRSGVRCDWHRIASIHTPMVTRSVFVVAIAATNRVEQVKREGTAASSFGVSVEWKSFECLPSFLRNHRRFSVYTSCQNPSRIL